MIDYGTPTPACSNCGTSLVAEPWHAIVHGTHAHVCTLACLVQLLTAWQGGDSFLGELWTHARKGRGRRFTQVLYRHLTARPLVTGALNIIFALGVK